MRLFIAVKLTDEFRAALAEVREDLRRRGVRGRYVPPENLHITLAFIGEYPDPGPVLEAADSVSFRPFEIALHDLGAFGGGVLWAGIRPPDPMEELAGRLRCRLAEAGIPYDRQDFRPHITLVRNADIKKELPEVRIPAAAMTVDRITLFRSNRAESGMIYTEL